MSLPLAGRRVGLLTSSASRLGGGVFEAVVAQGELVTKLGGEPAVFALNDAHSEADRARFGRAQVHYADIVGPRQIGFAPALLDSLLGANLDCLHLHGIWMYPSRAGAAWAKRTGRPYIISPHGMLDRWITARGRWKKGLARIAYERPGWRRATFLHALTEREARDIARESGRKDNVVIANAGPEPASEVLRPSASTFLYIGRIHPKKNLIPLVEGWTRARRIEGARLVIAGWGDAGAIEALERAVAAADGTVAFVGPAFGERKRELLEAARFVVLPSLSEGLPMAILEGWALGKPALMTGECNLPDGFAQGAALDCGYTADSIAVAITRASAMPEDDWTVMGRRALELASRQFSPAAVAAHWAEAYSRAMKGDLA